MIGLAQMIWATAWLRAYGSDQPFSGVGYLTHGPYVTRDRLGEHTQHGRRVVSAATREYYAIVDRIDRGEAP